MIFRQLTKHRIPFAVMMSYKREILNDQAVIAYDYFAVVPSSPQAKMLGFRKSYHSKSVLEKNLDKSEVSKFADYGLSLVHQDKNGKVWETPEQPIKTHCDNRKKFNPRNR